MSHGFAGMGEGLRSAPSLKRAERAARSSARKLAEAILPASMVVWRRPAGATSEGGAGRVALTFDDGPDEMTPEYLSVLADLGVRSTFFLIGSQCEQKPELVTRIAEAGHEVGAHGYTHRRFPSLRRRELRTELSETQRLLPPTASKPLVRPPHGAMSFSSMLTCARAGFTTVLWSHDSNDCRTERASDVIASFERIELRHGDIVLMHEGQRWTIDALPRVVERLREAGHALVTVGELLDG